MTNPTPVDRPTATHATHSNRRPTGQYCAYCGRNCSDRDQQPTDVCTRTFCDADCESAWNIDATDTVARP